MQLLKNDLRCGYSISAQCECAGCLVTDLSSLADDQVANVFGVARVSRWPFVSRTVLFLLSDSKL